MRIKAFGGRSSLLQSAMLAGLIGTAGCGSAVDDTIVEAQEPIINGNTVSTDVIGSAYLTMTNPTLGTHCSGTVIRSNWVLTAHHCVSENAARFGGTAIQPSQITAHILNGGNTPSGRLIVRHPSLDAALVKLTAAPTGPSLATYPNWISLTSNASLVGQSFFGEGWGANAITSCSATPGSTGAGVLRSATLPLSSLGANSEYTTLPNSSGQIAFSGDSGSSLYQQVRSYFRPIGVASYVNCTNNPPLVSESHYVRADAIRGWFQGVAGFAPTRGQTMGYERSDGLTAFTYVEPNSLHIKEISTNGGGVYAFGDLTSLSGAQTVMRGTQISSYVRTDGVNAVVYLGGDANIYELTLTGSGWGRFNMTASLGLPSASGVPSAYVRSDDTSAVVYVGSNQHVYEMRLPSGGSAWLTTDLSAAAGLPTSPGGRVAGYVRSDGTDTVVYRATNDHIIELTRNGSQWSAGDLTAITGAPLAAGAAIPYTRPDGYSIVLYRTSAGHIEELSLGTGTFSWGAGDLTAFSGCANASTDPSPYVRMDSGSAVLFSDANQHVYELALREGSSSWGCRDLTAATGAPAAFTPPTGFVGGDRVNYVVFSALNGHIWQLSSTTQSPGWSKQDMTAAAGGP